MTFQKQTLEGKLGLIIIIVINIIMLAVLKHSARRLITFLKVQKSFL